MALWSLKAAGLKVVPITGRPAGLCDHIARMWPVHGIVGENGAFHFWHDENEKRLKKRFMDSEQEREKDRPRLERAKEEILASVPGTALAGDQRYRETDLAVDYCEDVAPLPWAEVKRICEIFKEHGARCKVSSIHVKGWFGDYDKLATTRAFAREQWGINLEDQKHRFLFCGDSPNDEPMFQYFPHAAGVKNILRFTGRMRSLPAFLASRESGEGFAEIAGTILSFRRSPPQT